MDEYIKRKDAIAGLRNVDDVRHVKAVHSQDVVPLVCGEWLEVQFRTVPYNRIEKANFYFYSLSIMAIYLVIHDLIIPEIHEKLEEREWNKLCH